MGRGIHQTIAGHDAVITRAAYPVMDGPFLIADVDELDPRPRRKEEIGRRLGPVAAMMRHVWRVIGGELDLHLSGAWVTAREDTRVSAAGRLAAPHESVHNEQILRRRVARRRMRSGPQDLAGLCRQARHGVLAAADGVHVLAAGEQDHILMDNQRRPEQNMHGIPARDRFRGPDVVPTAPVATGHSVAVMKIETASGGSQRHRSNPLFLTPEHLSRAGIDGEEPARTFVPVPIAAPAADKVHRIAWQVFVAV